MMCCTAIRYSWVTSRQNVWTSHAEVLDCHVRLRCCFDLLSKFSDGWLEVARCALRRLWCLRLACKHKIEALLFQLSRTHLRWHAWHHDFVLLATCLRSVLRALGEFSSWFRYLFVNRSVNEVEIKAARAYSRALFIIVVAAKRVKRKHLGQVHSVHGDHWWAFLVLIAYN